MRCVALIRAWVFRPFLACLALVAAQAMPAAAVTRIPLEDLFADSQMRQVRISPDGTKIAYLTPFEGRLGIALFDVATGTAERLVRAEENIDAISWKGSSHLLYYADVGGNERPATQVIDVRTRRIRRLFESYGENNATRSERGSFGGVLSSWPASVAEVIAYTGAEENSADVGIFAVNINNGRRRPIPGETLKEAETMLTRLFDEQGVYRFRVRFAVDRVLYEYRSSATSRWELLLESKADLQTLPLAQEMLLADGKTLLAVDPTVEGAGVIVAFDLTTGRALGEVARVPAPDVLGIVLTPDRTKIAGISYADDRPRVKWLEPTLAGYQAAIDKLLPQTSNTILSYSEDLKRVIVYSGSDREPGGYFVLDTTGARPRLNPLGAVNPKLDPKHLQPMKSVSYTARDGLVIPAYLTLPPGAEGRRVPLILNPHGGPYGVRDYWGFNPEVQWLANRGYAVLQPNYRGSGGYGRAHLEAGRLEWGAKMQDDLTDAVKWAIDEGIADPDRVAIYGASYGGYAALAGVTFTPELYRCALNYVGVSDMTVLFGRDRGGRRGSFDAILRRIFGDLWIHPDTAVLEQRSPVNFVDRIQVPTFHAYGKNDPRVEFVNWTRLKAQLDKHGKTYDYFNAEDEGHGFENYDARVQVYAAMEAFLKKHMPAD